MSKEKPKGNSKVRKNLYDDVDSVLRKVVKGRLQVYAPSSTDILDELIGPLASNKESEKMAGKVESLIYGLLVLRRAYELASQNKLPGYEGKTVEISYADASYIVGEAIVQNRFRDTKDIMVASHSAKHLCEYARELF